MAGEQVVILGGGFGALAAARALAPAPVAVTLLDRTNHDAFPPLLYQVATAGLSPAEIASPIRRILARQRNLAGVLAEATWVDAGGVEPGPSGRRRAARSILGGPGASRG